MMLSRTQKGGLFALLLAAPVDHALASAAQPDSPPTPSAARSPDDIIVTARKRDETSLSAPVVVTAVSAAQMNRYAVNNLDGLARIVPQLIIAPQGGSVQGGEIAIRGIAGPDSNPFGDQAVSFNFDGVQIAKATVRRLSEMDVDQVEVLKGPQALFFGKNSPAGIVSIRTADPTRHFEVGASLGYEVYGREIRSDGYVSGPLTDTLGIRVAGYVSHLGGYMTNHLPSDAYVASTTDHRFPKDNERAIRLTLKYEPDSSFSARFKFNYFHLSDNGPVATQQYISCPLGSPQTGAVDDCRPNSHGSNYGSGPLLGQIAPIFEDGANFDRDTQFLSSLELNYHLSSTLLLTSVTGYYHDSLMQSANYEGDYNVILPSANPYRDSQFSQELRLQTSYDGPINITLGAFYSRTSSYTASPTYLFATNDAGNALLAAGGLDFIPVGQPFQIQNYALQQRGVAYSGFAQLVYRPISTIEIDIGGRYSKERKRVPLVRNQAFGSGDPFGNNPLTAADDVPATAAAPHRAAWHDFSPEVTASYRPTSKLTLFASYKHGFLSGGFNSGSTDFTQDLRYNPMTVKGVEAGIKALLFDNRLRINLAGYLYDVSNLQVTNFINATNFIRNAASAKVRGIEGDFAYRTPLKGLGVHGAAAYNHAIYTSFPDAPCYNGQTNALGCFIDAEGNPFQNLHGAMLPRAPRWALNTGFDYQLPLSAALLFGLSGGVSYTSRYATDVTDNPQGFQHNFALVDATVRLADADQRWELALIGKNLTNRYYFASSSNVPFTGSAAGQPTGVLGDVAATLSRGREVMIRLSVKYRSGS